MGTNSAQNRRAEKRDEQRQRKARAAGNEYVLDTKTIQCLAALVVCMVDEGGAVRIGRTRDGGALAIGLYKGEESLTEYVRPSESLNDALVEIADVWLDKGAEAYIGLMERWNTPATR